MALVFLCSLLPDNGECIHILILRKDPTTSTSVLCDKENIKYIFCEGKLAVEDGRLAW